MGLKQSDFKHCDMMGSMGEIGDDGDAIGGSDTIAKEGNGYNDDGTNENWSDERKSRTYPDDCYSFLALHGPFDNPKLFAFGMMVWIFQIGFFSLMLVRVAFQSQNEDLDNPDKGYFANFIPSNLSLPSRLTQFMALLSYCIFADESLKDIVRAVELFPRFSKAKPQDKARNMAFSCALRFTQGVFATLVVLGLVVTTSDIIDIVLNFTAVNFISAFDDVAFELAQGGKYGAKCKAEAHRIEELTLPNCMYRKHDHVRYLYTVCPIAIFLFICMGTVSLRQDAENVWFTQRLRVQFKDGTLYEDYSGCYDLDLESASWFRKREDYKSFEANPKSAKFGYCEEKKKWMLYEGNDTDACNVQNIAYSDKTFFYDISMTFENTWYSRSGRPLELYFFDEDNDLTDGQCGSFLGDGICNSYFDSADYDYDEGDCCAATCDETVCGIGAMTRVFDTDIVAGNGFPFCKDPIMKPITIRLNEVFITGSRGSHTQSSTELEAPREPLMILDCDNKNVLTVSINVTMWNKTETVNVTDGANCIMMLKNSTVGLTEIWYADYTIFHGDENSIENDPIVIARGDSSVESVIYFRRIEDCYLAKLEDHIDKTTVYTGTDPSNQAISWLMKDSKGFSSCERSEFLERYALTVVNFAASINDGTNDEMITNVNDQQLGISTARHCVWQAVGCTGGIVTELIYDAHGVKNVSGTIATEIGLLTNLTYIGMDVTNLHGSIPSEIGELDSLITLSISGNSLTGSIPTEIGELTNLEFLSIHTNFLSGSIPSQIGKLKSLKSAYMWVNLFDGSIPSEISELSSLEIISIGNNSLIGTIPSVIGELDSLEYFRFDYNFLTGTIPSELGQISMLSHIYLDENNLTGSVPWEILSKNLTVMNVYGNNLKDLIPVDGHVTCPEAEGEHYCDCNNNCLSDLDNPLFEGNCACEAGEACCKPFLEQNSECILCPDGLENPNTVILTPKNKKATCFELYRLVRNDISIYGTKESCLNALVAAQDGGCKCTGGPRFTECIFCEGGVENPDFYVEEYGKTCDEASVDAGTDRASFGEESQCIDARTKFTASGCNCKIQSLELDMNPGLEEGFSVEEYTECIVCEWGFENPEFFLEKEQTQCEDSGIFIKDNIADFGTKNKCDETRSRLAESGCTCKGNSLDLEATSDGT